MRMFRGLVGLILALLLWGGVANAQNSRGSILGHVQDSSGAAVPNTKVTLINSGTGVSSSFSTTATGDFVFVNVIPGTYSLKVEANGFKSASSAGLILQVDQTLRQNFTLQIGDVAEHVTVTAEAQMVQADNATIGQVITDRQIHALPLSGQDFTNLLAVNAGVTQASGGIQTTIFSPHGLNTQFRSVSVDGARAGSVSYIIDGVTDTDFFFSKPSNVPPADAIQEFKLQNGLYSAEYGFGSAQVNVALKTGTNQVHGGAYDFLENSAFQPQNPINASFNQRFGTKFKTNPRFVQNLFGGFVGGPVVLPKLYHGQDKTFWFFSYSAGRKRSSGAAGAIQVPTLAERGGDFSDWPYPIYDPSTTGSVAPVACTPNPTVPCDPSGRTPFPGNKIPSSEFNAIALNLMNYFPKPNINCTMPCQNYAFSVPSPLDTNVYTGRFDHFFSSKDQVSFSVNAGNIKQAFNSFIPQNSSAQLDHSYLLGLQYERTFTPNAVAVFRMGYNRENFHEGSLTAFGPNLSANLGFANVPNIPAFYGLPNVSMGSQYPSLGNGNNGYSQKDNIYQYAGNFAYTRGAHTFHVGADIRRIQLWDVDGFVVNGRLNFRGAYTSSDPTIFGASGVPGPNSGNGFADLLLGDPLSVGAPAPLGSDIYNVRGTQYGFYFQDDYRVTPRLTLNIGTRYEVAFTPHSIGRDGSVLNLQTPGGGLIWADPKFIAGFSGPSNIMNTYFQCCVTDKLVAGQGLRWQPRIGFAWRPFDTAKFVVRGGYGIYGDLYNRFYDATNYDNNLLFTVQANPNYATASGSEAVSPLALNTLWLPPITINPTVGFPAPWRFGVQTQWPLNQNPYTQQWSLDLQYALTPTTLVDVGYVGSHGLYQSTQNFFNQGDLPTTPDVLPNGAVCNSLRDASQATGSFAGCPGTGSAFQPIDTRDPFPNFSPGSYANANVLSSHYNSLQVRLDRRFSGGLTFLANYTWSRSLDENSEIATFSNGSGGSNEPVQPRNVHFDYGPSDYDQTHRLVASYVYEFPVGKGKRWSAGPANWIIGDWKTSGIVTFASGLPFSVFCCSRGQRIDLTGNPFGDRLRTNVSGNPNSGFTQTTSEWFNTSVFSVPALGTFGNSSRNMLRAPMMRQGNITFMKDFRITERQSLQYRFDIYNVFSSWHDGNKFPVHSLPGSPNFGSLIVKDPNSPYFALGNQLLWTPRVIQMALRYTF